MIVLKIYNFCPYDIEVAKIMRKMRRNGNKRLISFHEVEEVKTRGGRFKKQCGVTHCNLYCRISYLTSVLTYDGSE